MVIVIIVLVIIAIITIIIIFIFNGQQSCFCFSATALLPSPQEAEPLVQNGATAERGRTAPKSSPCLPSARLPHKRRTRRYVGPTSNRAHTTWASSLLQNADHCTGRMLTSRALRTTEEKSCAHLAAASGPRTPRTFRHKPCPFVRAPLPSAKQPRRCAIATSPPAAPF